MQKALACAARNAWGAVSDDPADSWFPVLLEELGHEVIVIPISMGLLE